MLGASRSLICRRAGTGLVDEAYLTRPAMRNVGVLGPRERSGRRFMVRRPIASIPSRATNMVLTEQHTIPPAGMNWYLQMISEDISRSPRWKKNTTKLRIIRRSLLLMSKNPLQDLPRRNPREPSSLHHGSGSSPSIKAVVGEVPLVERDGVGNGRQARILSSQHASETMK